MNTVIQNTDKYAQNISLVQLTMWTSTGVYKGYTSLKYAVPPVEENKKDKYMTINLQELSTRNPQTYFRKDNN